MRMEEVFSRRRIRCSRPLYEKKEKIDSTVSEHSQLDIGVTRFHLVEKERCSTIVTQVSITFSTFSRAQTVVEQTGTLARAARKPMWTIDGTIAELLAERSHLHTAAVTVLR